MNPLQPRYIEPPSVTTMPQTGKPVTTTPQTEEPVTTTSQTEEPVTTTPQTEKPILTPFPQKGKNESDVGMILGIVFGVIALLLLIALVLLFLRRSRRQPKLINHDIG